MSHTRRIRAVYKGQPTLEGAGVRLNRVFGHAEVPTFDPFLLLDDFRSRNPRDYLAGFPWHPHRGIETVTYMLQGKVEHGDSLGNSGIIGPGDMQWMTAGSGIIHQEMPKAGGDGSMGGLQLWVNLPAEQMMTPPRYREIRAADIPGVEEENGVSVKVISGHYGSLQGPARDIVADPSYFDVSVPAGATFRHEVEEGHTVLAYVLEGEGKFDPAASRTVRGGELVLFDTGTDVSITGARDTLRLLFISGRPLGEPVAWYGPIVMNTQEELQLAFQEYRNGTFIKDG
ncbi:MAG: pirin family protein [Candidatus Aminicenantaceae bacterium]